MNHISPASAQFQDFVEKGDESPYAEMFVKWKDIWPNGTRRYLFDEVLICAVCNCPFLSPDYCSCVVNSIHVRKHCELFTGTGVAACIGASMTAVSAATLAYNVEAPGMDMHNDQLRICTWD